MSRTDAALAEALNRAAAAGAPAVRRGAAVYVDGSDDEGARAAAGVARDAVPVRPTRLFGRTGGVDHVIVPAAERGRLAAT